MNHCIEKLERELVLFETPEALMSFYWRLDEQGMTWDEFRECQGFDPEGNEIQVTPDDEIGSIREQGFWGFSSEKEKKVYAWIAPDADPPDIMFFFGHELGHTVGKPVRGYMRTTAATMKEENRADEYGSVAMLAYEWLERVKKNKQG